MPRLRPAVADLRKKFSVSRYKRRTHSRRGDIVEPLTQTGRKIAVDNHILARCKKFDERAFFIRKGTFISVNISRRHAEIILLAVFKSRHIDGSHRRRINDARRIRHRITINSICMIESLVEGIHDQRYFVAAHFKNQFRFCSPSSPRKAKYSVAVGGLDKIQFHCFHSRRSYLRQFRKRCIRPVDQRIAVRQPLNISHPPCKPVRCVPVLPR